MYLLTIYTQNRQLHAAAGVKRPRRVLEPQKGCHGRQEAHKDCLGHQGGGCGPQV